MDAPALRPLGIGETLDVAIKLYRARFTTLAKAVAVVVAPVYVLAALVTPSLADDEPQPIESTPGAFDAEAFWTFVAGLLVVGFAVFVAGQLATAASFKIVSGTYLGEEPTWRESLRFAVTRLRSVIWLSILFYVLFFLALLLLVIPGIYLYAAWAVAFPVLLLEDIRGRKALKRSRRLVKGRWWPVAAVILLTTILTSLVANMLSGILVGATAGAGNDLLDAIASAIGKTAGAVIATPFTAAAIMVLYFDLRVRKEGFDLELLARGVGVEPGEGDRPVAPPPPPPRGEPGQPPFWPPPPGWRPADE